VPDSEQIRPIVPDSEQIKLILIGLLPFVFAVTVHEFAHGWVASKFGDTTARDKGRLTLNPLKHIDPIGTVVLPIITLITSSVIIGWALPVPIARDKLHHPRRDMMLVAAAGPLSNLLMLLVWAVLLKIVLATRSEQVFITQPLIYMCGFGVFVNAILMIINLFPLLPLDGGRIVVELLPEPAAKWFNKIEPFGLLIFIVLFISGLVYLLLDLVIAFVYFIGNLFGYQPVLQYLFG
jgi:Zn-dependent protease